MPIEILMPALSPTMETGRIARWLVKEGDRVAAGDVIAEIETDKATMELEAVDEGTVGRILVPEGAEDVKVGTPIALLLEEGETAEDLPRAADAGEGGPAPRPHAEAPAAPAPAPAPASGAQPVARSEEPEPETRDTRIFASPLARRLAREHGLDLSTITGSGPHGRIVRADVERALAAGTRPAPAPAAPPPEAATGTDSDRVKALYAGRAFEEVKLDGMRRTIAARLSEAKRSIPHFYLRRTARIDNLLALRRDLNAALAARGVKLSVNDLIIKACALALKEVPDANAVWAGDRILRMKVVDVAVAVAVPGGLFTPVIRDADVKTLSAISTEMKDLAERARARRLAPEEYQGGSFAISNLGMFGIDNFDAVINPPHGSILAVGAGKRQPVVTEDDRIEVATMLSLTLSVDHRVIDGALGAEFLAAIVRNLESPLAMLA